MNRVSGLGQDVQDLSPMPRPDTMGLASWDYPLHWGGK